MTTTPLRDFLEIPYDQLEEMNLEAKAERLARTDPGLIAERRLRYLADERRIKAVTACFTDLEGRFHMLDYDKKYLLRAADNLTFDGSAIRGFAQQTEGDLRLAIDWPAFYWLPADIFGPGKVLVFGEVRERDGTPYRADLRAKLKAYCDDLWERERTVAHISNEIEGFLFRGRDAERRYLETRSLELISTGGYYHSLPGDALRQFIDAAAEVQRAMGFANEKDHPEVAPSQFEMNYAHSEATVAADQAQLYKLLSRQVAARMEMTASFLPKPVAGVNGNGMHTNISFEREGRNLFWDPAGQDQLSASGWRFAARILESANDLCLILNSSVNAYRRLDPAFEAPNQIRASAIDRGAMIRIPLFNERSARVEVRSIGPDANPYLAIYALLRTGLEGPEPVEESEPKRPRTRFLPDNIYDAIRLFKAGKWAAELLGEELQGRYAEVKMTQAERSPKALGTRVKTGEIQFHHEVTNQYLWSKF
ncbi:MAG: glutamine synthetase [Acidobacteria bacterium]|jgi:glutamine synthetase|nr:glutamine synthetase [Thermoanaerobaculia bacterium]NLN10292.1 glutamine synthetase [Acidobacteriota bacterium]MBP7812513.1 glutamine synthetase [Thermoanaerobaculia bacterium]MBP8845225.1 glutamine synthetase [Thermoanaerobaculia bacterium]HNU82480.1 glutamine synthetase family protein [Thermoanaerobaculia bacterium]